jgi:hypothetical protein
VLRSQFRGSAIAREKLNQVVVDDLFQAGYNRVEGCIGPHFGGIKDELLPHTSPASWQSPTT